MRKVTEKVELGGHEIILPSWADGVQLEVDLHSPAANGKKQVFCLRQGGESDDLPQSQWIGTHW
jgi:hypothetical protein